MQGPMTPNRRYVLVSFLLGVGSCVSYEPRLARMEAALGELSRQVRQSQDTLEHSHDADVRRLWGKLNCTDERVQEFVKQCEAGSDACSDKSVANAMAFMDTQHYAVIYLRPENGLAIMHPIRRGQILSILDTNLLFPSTRYLILAMPQSESAEHIQQAEQIAREFLRYLRNEMGVPKRVRILGPQMLPCKNKRDSIQFYQRRIDRPQQGEPTGRAPKITLWLIRTDC